MDQNIFISYRRGDSGGYAGRIYDSLQGHFGDDRVFIDVTNIGIGENFRDAINQAIGSCQLMIVLIGPNWHSIMDEMGRRRLDDPHDFVRLEVQAALDRNVLILPVLVHGTKMPNYEDLPYGLRELSNQKPIEIRQRRFDGDVENLIIQLEKFLGGMADEDLEPKNNKLIRRLPIRGWLLLFLFVVVPIYSVIWFGKGKDESNISSEIENNSTATTVPILTNNFTRTPEPRPESQNVIPSISPEYSSTKIPAPSSTQSLKIGATNISLPTQFVDSRGATSVLVPQGLFTMGTDMREPWDMVSRPARLIGLDMYYIDMYEVSNVQYSACVSDSICKAPLHTRSKTRLSYYDNPEYANYPVVYVSWKDAQTFCSWRGGRLPRETEWEKAARGEEFLHYPWGDENIDCDHANYWPEEACLGDTSPVDSLPDGTSPYGVFHMSGNVEEWVDDWFQVYPEGDPNASKKFGEYNRVIRGGAYFDGPFYLRVTSRRGLDPEAKRSYVGFRCVIDIKALP